MDGLLPPPCSDLAAANTSAPIDVAANTTALVAYRYVLADHEDATPIELQLIGSGSYDLEGGLIETFAWSRSESDAGEGAAVARQNSMVMAERREAEKAMRKSRQPLPSTTGASGAEGEGGEGAYPEHAALAAALAAEVEAEAEAEAAAAPPPATRLQRSRLQRPNRPS